MKTRFLLLILLVVSFSCSEMNLELPPGPDGKSAYELWVEGVNNGKIDWSKDRTQIEHFYLYMKGNDGKDGLSAYELWVKEVQKGINDPHNPGKEWDKNKTETNDFWYFLTGADGKNGSTPQIGENGNWWIDGEDTGIPSKGKDGQDGQDGNDGSHGQEGGKGQDGSDGQDGKDGEDGTDGTDGRTPEVTIGENGNWWIDGIDTGKPAFGENGEDGQAAYELWKEEVAKGLINPHDENGGEWPKDKTSVQDFWEYLSGKDGKDGEDGECDHCDPCDHCHPCDECIEPILGYANVLAMPDGVADRLPTGEVVFFVYNDAGEEAPYAVVKGLPGMDPEKEYTADEYGMIFIHNKDLPEGKTKEELTGSVQYVTYKKVIEGGQEVTEMSAPNTVVPSKIKVRASITHTPINSDYGTYFGMNIEINKGYSNSKWESIIPYLQYPIEVAVLKLSDKNDPTSFDKNDSEEVYFFDDPYITIPKRIVRPSYLNSGYPIENEWTAGEDDHYYTIYCEELFGEEVILPVVIKGCTQQFMPLFNEMKVSGGFTENGNLTFASVLKASFDVSSIDPEHLYKSKYIVDESMKPTVNGVEYTYYIPEKAGDDFYTNYLIDLKIRITHNGNHYFGASRFSDPHLTIDNAVVYDQNGDKIEVYIASDYQGGLLNPATPTSSPTGEHALIGELVFDKSTQKLVFKGRKDSGYNIPDIDVTNE